MKHSILVFISSFHEKRALIGCRILISWSIVISSIAFIEGTIAMLTTAHSTSTRLISRLESVIDIAPLDRAFPRILTCKCEPWSHDLLSARDGDVEKSSVVNWLKRTKRFFFLYFEEMKFSSTSNRNLNLWWDEWCLKLLRFADQHLISIGNSIQLKLFSFSRSCFLFYSWEPSPPAPSGCCWFLFRSLFGGSRDHLLAKLNILSPPAMMMKPKHYLADQRFIINFGLLFDCFSHHALFIASLFTRQRCFRTARIISCHVLIERFAHELELESSDGSLIIVWAVFHGKKGSSVSYLYRTVIRCFSSIIGNNLGESDLSPTTSG